MKISAKGRYALVSMIGLAQRYPMGEFTTVIKISEYYGISKIYLEQVFSRLKHGGVVISIKGSQGGYQLARSPKEITLLDILSAVELTLFENNEETVPKTAPEIEKTLRQSVYNNLDNILENAMRNITLEQLVQETDMNKSNESLMFYI